MADTKQTPGEEPEAVATAAEPATETAPEKAAAQAAGTPAQDADGGEADAGDATDDEVLPAERDNEPDSGPDSEPDAEPDAEPDDEPDAEPDAADDLPAGPSSTRLGWVVAAFLFFWPLAIPALVLSMRTAEANGIGNARRARKSSVRALDFALSAVVIGALGIVGLAVGIAAAPTYASSLPAGFVSTARSFVPPALAGPLGIAQPDAGAELAAPSSSPTPSEDPYATADPYAPEPGSQSPGDGPVALPTPGAGGPAGATDEPTPQTDSAATAGAEIPDLAVGDCFDTAATSGQTTLYRIPVVACTTAHGGEIYAETTAPDSLAKDGATPSQQALWDAADAYCYPEFTKFVGMRWAQSELRYWPIAPSEQSWAEGDRRILCVVESEQPVTGTLEGAER